MPSNHIISRAWPSACATIVSIDWGMAMANPGSTVLSAVCTTLVTASSRKVLRTAIHRELKILLGPGAVDFHLVRFRDGPRPHVAHDADDFHGRARTRDQKCLADRIFVAENFARTGLTDQHHVLMIGYVMLIEIASRQNRNAPGLEIIRSDIVAGGCGTLIQRQNFSVRPGVKRVTGGGGDQRNIGADRGALDTWNPLQRRESFFHETLAGGDIGIWRLWQRDQADPHIFGTEPNVLPAQLHEARNE